MLGGGDDVVTGVVGVHPVGVVTADAGREDSPTRGGWLPQGGVGVVPEHDDGGIGRNGNQDILTGVGVVLITSDVSRQVEVLWEPGISGFGDVFGSTMTMPVFASYSFSLSSTQSTPSVVLQ